MSLGRPRPRSCPQGQALGGRAQRAQCLGTEQREPASSQGRPRQPGLGLSPSLTWLKRQADQKRGALGPPDGLGKPSQPALLVLSPGARGWAGPPQSHLCMGELGGSGAGLSGSEAGRELWRGRAEPQGPLEQAERPRLLARARGWGRVRDAAHHRAALRASTLPARSLRTARGTDQQEETSSQRPFILSSPTNLQPMKLVTQSHRPQWSVTFKESLKKKGLVA